MTDTLAALRARSDDKLTELIEEIETEGVQEASLGEAYLDRRGADVLAHLHGWHLQFLEWLRADAAGEDVVMPAPGYTWDDIGAYNDVLYERYRGLGYPVIKDLVTGSHCRMFGALAAFEDGAVTDPERFPWAGGPLITVADECAGKHYDWGLKRVAEALDGA